MPNGRNSNIMMSIILGITFVYRWQGKVNRNQEHLLMIKTTQDKYVELEKIILANHSYDCPEIIMLPIEGCYNEYLTWLQT